MRSIIVVVLAATALTAVPSAAAANGAVTVNRGACMSQISPDLKPYQAPGQNGVGPFTIVNGEHHTALAFDGAAGCTH